MPSNLKVEFPSQGWTQILTARTEMLDAFDSARAKAKAHEVETYHGKVAEATFRKWLSDFLPGRYGVAAGYLISSGRKSTDKVPHFDVLIYDRLESPVLWIEGDPDVSSHGRSLAVPVEYVRAVLEIKSSFSPTSVEEALQHLGDLLPLMGGPDDPDERYKLHLPPTFCCGMLFFDLKREFQFSETALNRVLEGHQYRGFFGGMILRGEGHATNTSGKLMAYRSEEPIESDIGRDMQSLLDGFVLAGSRPVSDSLHVGAGLSWAEMHFSQFAFDLIAMMQGTYDGRLSSFCGVGYSGLHAVAG